MLPQAGLLASDSIYNTHSSTQLSTLAHINPTFQSHSHGPFPILPFWGASTEALGGPYFSLAQFDHFLAVETQDRGSYDCPTTLKWGLPNFWFSTLISFCVIIHRSPPKARQEWNKTWRSMSPPSLSGLKKTFTLLKTHPGNKRRLS